MDPKFQKTVEVFLEKRGITEPFRVMFNIHSGFNSTLGPSIVIPVYNQDGTEVLFNKYRRSPDSQDGPKYLYDHGGSVQLFGAWKAKDAKTVLWCEGELDAVAAWAAGVPAVSSTGGAKSTQESWRRFFSDKAVFICFDSDKAGGEGMVDAFFVAPHGKFIFLPKGFKDISEFIESGGNLNGLLLTAVSFSSVDDIMAHRQKRLVSEDQVFFHDAYLKERDDYLKSISAPDIQNPKFNESEVGRARQYPIPKLMKLNFGSSACCLWHNEVVPSLHYYPEDNHLYCFGSCGRAYDVIDVYKKLNNCTFTEAVKALNKLND